jgi:hypothetical protein
MTDDEHLAVEVAQFVQHVHDIADSSRSVWLPCRRPKRTRCSISSLHVFAVRAKQLEATSGTPEIASSPGYKVSAVIRTRVEELLKRQ